MNRNQFFDRHRNLRISQEELDRKYRMLQEEAEMQRLMEEAAYAQAQARATMSGVSGGIASTVDNTLLSLTFSGDATADNTMNIYFTEFQGLDRAVTVNWGDGFVETHDISTLFTHTYTVTTTSEFDIVMTSVDIQPGDLQGVIGFDVNDPALTKYNDMQGLDLMDNLAGLDLTGWKAYTMTDLVFPPSLQILNVNSQYLIDVSSATYPQSLQSLRFVDCSNINTFAPDPGALPALYYLHIDTSPLTNVDLNSMDLSNLVDVQILSTNGTYPWLEQVVKPLAIGGTNGGTLAIVCNGQPPIVDPVLQPYYDLLTNHGWNINF